MLGRPRHFRLFIPRLGRQRRILLIPTEELRILLAAKSRVEQEQYDMIGPRMSSYPINFAQGDYTAQEAYVLYTILVSGNGSTKYTAPSRTHMSAYTTTPLSPQRNTLTSLTNLRVTMPWVHVYRQSPFGHQLKPGL